MRHQSQNLKKKLSFFDFEDHFVMKKGLLTPILIIFFKILVRLSLIGSTYFLLFFDLDREKFIFQSKLTSKIGKK